MVSPPLEAGHLPDLLRDLHTCLLRKGLLRDEVDQTQRLQKRLENRIANAQKALQSHLDAIKSLRVTVHDKEVSIKANQQQSAKYLWQRNQVKEKKEYDALTHEMDNLKQINNVLEDEALTALTAIDEKAAQTPTLEQAVRTAEAELAQFHEGQKNAEPDRARRLQETEAEVAHKLSRLAPEARVAYNRVFAALKADCLAEVLRRSCTGCHTEVTGQQYNEVNMGRLVQCKSCNRLLYPEVESKPASSG